MKTPGSFWKNTLLVLFGIAAALLLAEAGLRIIGFSHARFYLPDYVFGNALRPNAEGWQTEEGRAYVRINSDGLRDREHAKIKSANIIRIAILGDSYAEAFQLPIEDTFWSVLERELNKCPQIQPKTIEVINFGMSGYGTARELLALRHRVWNYDPDVVLLAFFTGNDIRNNSKTLEKTEYYPYFYYEGGKLVLDNSFRTSKSFLEGVGWKGNIRRYLADSRLAQLLAVINNRARADAAPAAQTQTEAGLDAQIYVSPPPSKDWEEAWRVTEGLVSQMAKEVSEHGAKFHVVTLSNGIQVHPDSSIRKKYMQRLKVKNLDYPDLRIKTLGEKKNIDVLNLASSLLDYAEKNNVCVHGFDNATPCGGHWNAHGHAVAGKIIAKRLCEAAGK